MDGKRLKNSVRKDVKMPGVGRGNNPASHKGGSMVAEHGTVMSFAKMGNALKGGSKEHGAHFDRLVALAKQLHGGDKKKLAALAKLHDREYDAAKARGDDAAKVAHAKLWAAYAGLAAE